MALSRLVRKQKKTSSAKELIESAMRRVVRETPPMQPDDWLRISSIGAVCAREEVLRFRLGVPRRAGIDPNVGMTFEFGHDVHYMMQNKVMPATGKIVGSWRCIWCSERYGSIKHEGLVPRPEVCIRPTPLVVKGATPLSLRRIAPAPLNVLLMLVAKWIRPRYCAYFKITALVIQVEDL